jgi:hypothetical protein
MDVVGVFCADCIRLPPFFKISIVCFLFVSASSIYHIHLPSYFIVYRVPLRDSSIACLHFHKMPQLIGNKTTNTNSTGISL